MAIWQFELDVARIWRLHRPVLVEIGIPGMMFKGGYYQVLQMLNRTEIDHMKNFRYNNTWWRESFHIPEHTSGGSNSFIVQVLSRFLVLRLIILNCIYHLSEVSPTVSQSRWSWVPFSNWRFCCLTLRAMWQLDWVQRYIFEVVSPPWTVERISLPHLTICMKHKLSGVGLNVERTTRKL